MAFSHLFSLSRPKGLPGCDLLLPLFSINQGEAQLAYSAFNINRLYLYVDRYQMKYQMKYLGNLRFTPQFCEVFRFTHLASRIDRYRLPCFQIEIYKYIASPSHHLVFALKLRGFCFSQVIDRRWHSSKKNLI
jgi:hypothetical protein